MTSSHLVKKLPEELDFSWFSNHVKQLVEGDTAVSEMWSCVGFCVLKEAVNRLLVEYGADSE